MLKLFNVHQLPVDPAARFRAIFQAQPQWTVQALQAYVEDLQACFCWHKCPLSPARFFMVLHRLLQSTRYVHVVMPRLVSAQTLRIWV